MTGYHADLVARGIEHLCTAVQLCEAAANACGFRRIGNGIHKNVGIPLADIAFAYADWCMSRSEAEQ